MSGIRFGTDGWRAVIGRDFTFDNLGVVAAATAQWIKEEGVTENGVVIGYDARFMGRQFAEYAALVFASMEVPVRMAVSVTPTPAVSYAAKYFNAVGIAITASHNPPEYSGFKIKAPFGGSASPDQIAAVEMRLKSVGDMGSGGSGGVAGSGVSNDNTSNDNTSESSTESAKRATRSDASKVLAKVAADSASNPHLYTELCRSGVIRELDITDLYLEDVRQKIDLRAIQESGIRIAHDPMFGAGAGLLLRLLPGQVDEMHGDFNPSFLGMPPEPIEKNLKEFAAFVPANGCAIGIANDGDADRIGVMDEQGRFVDSHKLLSLLVQYLHQTKGMEGTIVKTVSTTGMLEKQAKAYGLPLTVTPIGFKYVAELIVGGDVLVGGEESGGLAVKGHLPERDGIYIGLLLVEMLVKFRQGAGTGMASKGAEGAEGPAGEVPKGTGTTTGMATKSALSDLVQGLYDEFGPHRCYRDDMHTEEWRKLAMMERCRAGGISEVCGLKVQDRDMRDGVKHLLEDGSWVMVRPSGTEPVLRIYSEAPDEEGARQLVEEVVAMVNAIEMN